MTSSGRILGLVGLLALLLPDARPARGAEDIGDISVSAAAIYTGETVHGYAEARVVLENNSAKSHVVTLTSPNKSYGSGNCISRIARSVTLSPGVTVVVSLLQPPLPGNGDSLIRVLVDGREEGTTRLPNANSHCPNYNRGGGTMAATAFISRSLDADGIQRMLNHNRTLFSAAMATGEPDTWTRGGRVKVWMPDNTASGQTNWLELGYDRPVRGAFHLEIHYTQPPVTSGFVDLTGTSGTNVATLNLAAGSSSGTTLARRGMGSTTWVQEFSFPTTSEPVKTVRINFGTTPPSAIAVDGVSLNNSSGQYFADTARASSENTAAAPPMSSYRGRFGGDPDSIQCLRAESALSDWSDNWLAYTPFDAVFLGAADLAAMPAPVAAAIGDYLQAGGVVVIMGATSLPPAWKPAVGSPDLADLHEGDAGFGTGFAVAATDPGRLSQPAVHRLHEIISLGGRYWASLPYDSSAANANLPVVENLKIPVRGITLIMLVFIIVVGPVNMFLLARKNRRTRMLWTIPAISLATTLFIFAYSLAREGITPNTRTAGFTILDQPGHHAATTGATGFYCPLTPSGGLRFDNETEATPLVTYENYGSGSAREVDWTQTQHFQRGWVTSRVPANVHLRKSEVRRERLEWQKVSGGWRIINGLGAPIKSLWLADKDLNFYSADNIPAGQSAILLPVRSPPVPGKRGAKKLFQHLGYSGTDPGPDVLNYLQPGTYIAVLDGNPFIENALGAAASARRTRSTGVVYGLLDSPAVP